MDQLLGQFQRSFGNLLEKLKGWIDGAITSMPNIILAALVMVLALVFSRLISKYFSRVARRITHQETIIRLLTNIATAAFMMLMLFLILGILNLDTALKSLLAGAGVAGLAIGLALQEPLVNLFSGILMSTRQYFNIGDLIETNGFMGYITQVNLRSTVVRNFQGQEVIIPNKLIYQSPLINYTISGERRIDLACGISYAEDLEQVREVAISSVEQYVSYDKNKPVQLFYREFGDSSINFTIHVWMDQCRQPSYLAARSEVVMALKKGFNENGITIPFPIRTLDFGIKGGEKLNQVFPMERMMLSNGDD